MDIFAWRVCRWVCLKLMLCGSRHAPHDRNDTDRHCRRGFPERGDAASASGGEGAEGGSCRAEARDAVHTPRLQRAGRAGPLAPRGHGGPATPDAPRCSALQPTAIFSGWSCSSTKRGLKPGRMPCIGACTALAVQDAADPWLRSAVGGMDGRGRRRMAAALGGGRRRRRRAAAPPARHPGTVRRCRRGLSLTPVRAAGVAHVRDGAEWIMSGTSACQWLRSHTCAVLLEVLHGYTCYYLHPA